MMKIIRILYFVALYIILGHAAQAATINAASCQQAAVQSAINSASVGDTVSIPGGSCSWTSVTLSKAITVNGAGQGVTVINVGGGNPVFSITNQSNGHVSVKNITFTASNNNNLPHPITVSGMWPNNYAVIFQNDTFNLNGATMFDIFMPGGVIFSHITFNGGWNDFLVTVKQVDPASWNATDSLGNHDTVGLKNVYIEDSTFNGGSNGIIDCDDSCRGVMRYNTFTESGGFNSHGKDSSPYGMRHFEIYNNSFTFPDKTCNNGNSSLSNVNQYIWIRGASGVVYNNSMENLSSQCWGDKPEIRLAIRGAEDMREYTSSNGSCSGISYPVSHQLGQNRNATSDFTDPIYFWNNTGQFAIAGDWAWGNPCGFNWGTFFQWGRDGINSTGMGGTPKPGYVPFTYPHPLTGTTPLPPQRPVITSPLSANGTVGTAFSYPITATNSPTSYGAAPLPAGLSINTATGLISGTPITAGTSAVSLTATNAAGSGMATLTLMIVATPPPSPPVITSPLSASGTVGSVFSYQITATNAPTSYGATGLPLGLAISSGSGLISGTPMVAGTSGVTISATNAGGTATAILNLTINAVTPPPTTTTDILVDGVVIRTLTGPHDVTVRVH